MTRRPMIARPTNRLQCLVTVFDKLPIAGNPATRCRINSQHLSKHHLHWLSLSYARYARSMVIMSAERSNVAT